jgi:hypothetical protein
MGCSYSRCDWLLREHLNNQQLHVQRHGQVLDPIQAALFPGLIATLVPKLLVVAMVLGIMTSIATLEHPAPGFDLAFPFLNPTLYNLRFG